MRGFCSTSSLLPVRPACMPAMHWLPIGAFGIAGALPALHADSRWLIALICSGFAAWFDLVTRRIPNAVSYATILVCVANAWIAGCNMHQFLGSLIACLLIGLLLRKLFSLGGGDVKLAVALLAAIGSAKFADVLIYATAIAGLLSLLHLVTARRLVGRLRRHLLLSCGDFGSFRQIRPTKHIPLALPFFLAVVVGGMS